MSATILVKLLATALAMSQATTRPDTLATAFDPERDRPAVSAILRDGCAHMRKAFDIEDINLDELISTAMEDPQAVAGDAKILQGLNFGELTAAYRVFCKGESGEAVDLGAVIRFYNEAAKDLPDHATLKGRKLPGISTILDGEGRRFTEVFEPDHRRIWVPLSDIPAAVQSAFVAAEDKRFYQHKGLDERGVIRAFVGNLAAGGRPAGGSTITQQVAKNLLVGDDVTYERKIREMIVATRLERSLTKAEILETYLNAIYLGRSSWGLEMAARSWFGKSARDLTAAEGALLAGLAKGPNYYSPERQPERARERLAYVLTRMQDDGALKPDEAKRLITAGLPQLSAFERPRRDSGLHFVDHLAREARTFAGLDTLTASSTTVRSTLNPALQRQAETALQDGLARYELSVGRQRFEGAEANLADAIAKATPGADPAWLGALRAARLPLYDVHWPAAIVLEKTRSQKAGEVIRVGLADGRILALNAWSAPIRAKLKLHDVVRVRIIEGSVKPAGKPGGKPAPKPAVARAELRIRPTVQGAVAVLENRTGRILAMVGGFSYPLSQLNRVTQAQRQPGSALKPITYLAALGRGLQPNTLVWDAPVTLPPVGRLDGYARAKDYWTPKNYDGGASGLVTLRRALETSKNLVTARLLEGGIADGPEQSLTRVCELAQEAQIYVDCVRHYPFVLGAQPLKVLDLAAFYAAIANEGLLPSPYALEAVEAAGKTLYRREAKPLAALGSADRAAFYQMKSMLQGVLARGTAAKPLRALAPFAAGKTGTTDGENDAWFVGFTNDVTVAVWVGHDNADGKRRTLGRGQTGAKLAAPIFAEVVEASWRHHAPKTALAPPSPEAERQLVALAVDPRTGDRVEPGTPGALTEHFRLDGFGKLAETQFRLVPREEATAMREPDPEMDGETRGGWWDEPERGPFAEAPRPRQESSPFWRNPFGWFDDEAPTPRQRPRRVDPDYPGYSRRYF